MLTPHAAPQRTYTDTWNERLQALKPDNSTTSPSQEDVSELLKAACRAYVHNDCWSLWDFEPVRKDEPAPTGSFATVRAWWRKQGAHHLTQATLWGYQTELLTVETVRDYVNQLEKEGTPVSSEGAFNRVVGHTLRYLESLHLENSVRKPVEGGEAVKVPTGVGENDVAVGAPVTTGVAVPEAENAAWAAKLAALGVKPQLPQAPVATAVPATGGGGCGGAGAAWDAEAATLAGRPVCVYASNLPLVGAVAEDAARLEGTYANTNAWRNVPSAPPLPCSPPQRVQVPA